MVQTPKLFQGLRGCRSLLITAALVLVVPVWAHAQLSEKDITELNTEAAENGWTFTIKSNDATLYPLEQICGTRLPVNYVKPRGHIDNSLGTASLPPTFDWRTVTPMPPIRNQGGCGSCWAFSTVGALECAIKLFEGIDVNLSEQWLVSCNQNGWDCAGGWLAFDYFLAAPDPCGGKGAVLESVFPYTATNGSCHCPYPHEYKIDNWAYVGGAWEVPSVAALKQAIMDHGPISVCVTATSAFQGYGGGVFNQINSDPINHAVVLVGWDDNQGTNGVWFLRNSWGNWGEGGYMRIAYNCCNVGYGAAYIDYGGVGFSASTKFGPGPDTVQFTSQTTRQVIGWNWEFGDGATSVEQNPVHPYAPGCYDVKLTVQTPTGNFSSTKTNFVMLYADTIVVDHVVGAPGKKATVSISTHNRVPASTMTVPISWGGTYTPSLDSVTFNNTRSAGASIFVLNEDPMNKRRSYLIDYSTVPGQELACGSGSIMTLYFRVPGNAPANAVLPVEVIPYGFQTPTVTIGAQSFTPEAVSGKITMCLAGDFNDDGVGPDIADLAEMISFLYLSGAGPKNPAKADIDGTVGIDIGDISALISYLYLSGPRLNCTM